MSGSGSYSDLPSPEALRDWCGEPHLRISRRSIRYLFADTVSQKALKQFCSDFWQGSRTGLIRLFELAHRLHAGGDTQQRIYAHLCAQVWTEGKRRSALQEFQLSKVGITHWDLLDAMSAYRCSETIMSPRDLETMATLPPKFTAWRGGCGSREHLRLGHSWTTKRDVARWFAERASERTGDQPRVVWRRVQTSDLVAVFAERGEAEIVVYPSTYAFAHCKQIPCW